MATRINTSTTVSGNGVIQGAQGAALASASTIAVTHFVHEVSGSATITTINGGLANALYALIPAAGATWALATGGNIAVASEATVGRPIFLLYDGATWRAVSGDVVRGDFPYVDVALYATGGSGTSGDPWTGWDTACPWASSQTFVFRLGHFSAPTLNLGYPTNTQMGSFTLRGAGNGTVLTFTDAGPGIFIGDTRVYSETPPEGIPIMGVTLDSFRINGNTLGTSTNGLETYGMASSTVRNIKITNFATNGWYIHGGTTTLVQNLRITGLDGDQTTVPQCGVKIVDGPGASNYTTTHTFIDCHITHTTQKAMWLTGTGHTVVGGAFEGNTGYGLYVEGQLHNFISAYTESNTSDDYIGGDRHTFVGTMAGDGTMAVAANDSTFIGGDFNPVDTGLHNSFRDMSYEAGTGVFTPNSTTKFENITTTGADRIRVAESKIVHATEDAYGADPGDYEVVYRQISGLNATPVTISRATYPTGQPWRVLFAGYWLDSATGPGLAQQPLFQEATSASPTFTVGARTITVSQTVAGAFQVAADDASAGFVGSIHIVCANYATGLGSQSIVLKDGVSAATGAFSGTVTASGGSNVVQTRANGEQWIRGSNTELMTIAAAATSTSVADLLPANSIIEAVVCRVTVLIPTAANFAVGDGTTAARFASGVAVAAGTTSVGLLHQQGGIASDATGPVQAAAAKIVITPNASPVDATGRVRVTVFYRQFVAPTS